MGGYYGDMDTFMIDEGILNKLVTFGSYDGLLLAGTSSMLSKWIVISLLELSLIELQKM